ncbi:hypothetical protein [Pseudothermotoga elfii]
MRILVIFTIILLAMIMSGCLSLLEPDIGAFAEQTVYDLNRYLKGNLDENQLIDTYVHLTDLATSSDAEYYGSMLLNLFSNSASEVELISYGETSVKSPQELQQPPSWVEKIYTLNLLLKTNTAKTSDSFAMLIINGKPYLLTVYASGSSIVCYPKIP